MLRLLIQCSFVGLGAIALILHLAARSANALKQSMGQNPLFLKFQYTYLAAYFTALFADWLQGPYLYKLYRHYGFMESQIAVIYSCGFMSTVIFGTWAKVAADRFGRQKLCIFFTIIYSISCFTKLSRDYGVLIVGRILSGIATSLMFYTFEAWYVYEHIERNDFPQEWIAVTIEKANRWNGILSVFAGIVAYLVADFTHMGPVAPFMLAIPFLLISGIIVMSQWKENYGSQTVHFRTSCMAGLRCIFSDERIFFLGTITALFESVMYIFVFIWTPLLMREPGGGDSLGLSFSCFMLCIMIGGFAYKFLRARGVRIISIITTATFCAAASMIMCVFSLDPNNSNGKFSFTAFLIMEFGVGLYFPAMGYLRAKIIPNEHLSGVLNWFRVPLNVIACAVLTILHGVARTQGNRMIFVMCTLLLTLCMVCILRFAALVKHDHELEERLEEEEIEMEALR